MAINLLRYKSSNSAFGIGLSTLGLNSAFKLLIWVFSNLPCISSALDAILSTLLDSLLNLVMPFETRAQFVPDIAGAVAVVVGSAGGIKPGGGAYSW